jgi:hypothetical protein
LNEAISKGKAEDPDVLQAHFLLGKMAFNEQDFEEQEKQFNILLMTPNLLPDETRDELLYKMCMMYRQCGYADDLEKCLKMHVECRKKLYGDNSSKLIDIVNELARMLQQRNKIDEAKPYCRQIIVHYELEREDPSMKANASSERVFCVLARNGDKKLAQRMLSNLAEEYQAGGAGLPFTMANYDLAAIAAMDGNDKECKKYIATADAALKDLNDADRIFASDGLRDWSLFLKGKDVDTHFVNQTIMAIPPPELRRHALREFETIKEVDNLKRPYDAKTKAHRQEVLAACKKFPPAKLTGLN